MKAFAQRLKQARETAGYVSAQSFAGALGVEPHAYRMYERGQREPPFETLERICSLLDIEPNFLFPSMVKSVRPRRGRQEGDGGASRAA
jgi:transcriptional regulator with XRE-family HTH domain